jgi:serine/threonine protein kinase
MSSIFPPVQNYTLYSILGKGSFGMVVSATDVLGQKFAIKMMNNHEEAIKEINNLRALPSHNNIVKFVEAFFDSGRYYIVLEYIEGCSLHSHLQTLGPNPTETTLIPILQQMLDAFVQIHAAGIVHMDVKPENFMYEVATGRVVLIDFGVSERTGSERTSPFIGTPFFLAPEVARTPEGPVDFSCFDPVLNQPSADIWSFGMVFQWIMTGKFPYKCLQCKVSLVIEIANFSKPEIVDDLRKNSSPFGLFMLDIVTRCLQIDPQLRPTAQELLTLMRGYKST